MTGLYAWKPITFLAPAEETECGGGGHECDYAKGLSVVKHPSVEFSHMGSPLVLTGEKGTSLSRDSDFVSTKKLPDSLSVKASSFLRSITLTQAGSRLVQ